MNSGTALHWFTRRRTGHRADNASIRSILACILAIVAWLAIWNTTTLPRAGYDSLWYSQIAYEYAGADRETAVDTSWRTFELYADPELVAYVRDRDGWPWQGGPERQRWVGIYRMRPLMPLVAAVGYPVLRENAPLLASLLATLVLTVAAVGLLGSLAGWSIVALFLGLTYANVLVAGWLVQLTTDGLGLALWFAALAAGAVYATTTRRRWLVLFLLVALALAFTRPLATVLPLAFALPAIGARLAHAPIWRRFSLLTIVAVIPIAVFGLWAAWAGMPTFTDLLQDVPTQHFRLPDHPNPLAFLLGRNVALLGDLLRAFATDPRLWIGLFGGVAGYAVVRRWWAAPFAASIAVLPITFVLHPILTEAPRTLAPIWLSLNLGLALLIVAVTRSWVGGVRRREGKRPSVARNPAAGQGDP